MLTVSTGYKHKLLGGTSFAAIFANSVVRFYSNAQPDSPNDAPGGSPVAIITATGGSFTPGSPTHGLNWTLSDSGYLIPSTPDWTLTGLATAALVWGRMSENNDDGTPSTSFARFDIGVNSVDGYGLLITNPSITAAEQRAVDFALFGIPPL